MADLGRALDAAVAGPGVVRVDGDGRAAEVDVIDADKLGVRVRRVRVEASGPLEASRVGPGDAAGGSSRARALHEEVERLTEAFRGLPERIVPVEVSPALGGAVLRSAPQDVENREYFEVRTDGRVTELERVHAPAGEPRRSVPFTLTREALARIVDRVAGRR